MRANILDAKKKGDSLGGIIESITTNLPVGLGEPIFGSLESDLSKAIFSIPSVKGIEFGSGFRGSERFGSENNDLYTIKKGKIITKTNNSGGILGGISNGMPITMRIAFKPASSIAQKQSTVDIKTKKETILQVKGRHDPCVVPRAPPVVDSLVALTIADHALLAGAIKAHFKKMSDINNLRNKMDEVTLEMIKLLKTRTDIAKEIGEVKKNIGKGITDESREDNLRNKVISLGNSIGLDESIATKFLNFLLNESVKVQSTNKQTHLSIFLKAKSLEQQGKKIIHMEVGEPDFLPPQIVKMH